MRAVDVAGEQCGAGLALEIIDPAADGVDRQGQPFGRLAEASAPNDFQEDAGRIPIGEAADVCFLAFLQGNAPFRQGVHTSPFGSLNWQNLAQTTTTTGWGTVSFERHTYRVRYGIGVLLAPGIGQIVARKRGSRAFRCEP